VDNGSVDGSPDFARAHYPWVKVIELSENMGFAEGNNRGLEACQGQYIVTLNNDTKVEPDFLTELVKAVESDGQIGMVAAKMLNFYKSDRIDSIGVKVARNGLGYNIGVGELDAGQYDEATEVFGPCAGAALYRRKMIDDIGFFDADFFAYYEDLDLAWRGRLAGWRCVTAPKAVVYHVHSATSGKGSPFTVFQIHRNKWYTLLKSWPAGLLMKRLPALLLIDLGAFALAVIRGRGTSALKARVDVVLNLRNLWQKRQGVQRRTKISAGEIEELFTASEHPWQTLLRKVDDK
jgi:GT2 family glycosyltransferase